MTRTHRELVYDPNHSTRRFKHFMRMTTSGHRAEEAYVMGQMAGAHPMDLPRRWRKNPYPPGRRRDLYDQGVSDGQAERDEERTYRRWNPD